MGSGITQSSKIAVEATFGGRYETNPVVLILGLLDLGRKLDSRNRVLLYRQRGCERMTASSRL